MKKIVVFSFVFLIVSNLCSAKILRVGYNGLPVAGVDYTTIGAAQTGATAGDTLQIYGPVQGATITKRLIIIGFGYNFDMNTNLQAVGLDKPSEITSLLLFELGSENSIIEGCAITQAQFQIATSNITVRRCFMNTTLLKNEARQVNNIKFEGCVLSSVDMSTANNPSTNVQFFNSVFNSLIFYLPATTGSIINCVTPTGSNSNQLNLSNAGFLVKNCILYNFNPNDVNTVWENNFFNTAQPANLPAGTNNRWGQSWANLFDRLGGTSDNPGSMFLSSFAENYYLLKAGSPSINGGFDSNNNPTDCGIFGGDAIYRYKLSGVPPIPAIYRLTAPTPNANSAPYNITISVRSNN